MDFTSTHSIASPYEMWMAANVTPPVRGMCKHYSELMVKVFPELRLAKGWYIDPTCIQHPHWWCVTPQGIIIDPTVEQFMLGGTYKEYDGPEPTGRCYNCGALVFEMRNFCSGDCEGQYLLAIRERKNAKKDS